MRLHTRLLHTGALLDPTPIHPILWTLAEADRYVSSVTKSWPFQLPFCHLPWQSACALIQMPKTEFNLFLPPQMSFSSPVFMLPYFPSCSIEPSTRSWRSRSGMKGCGRLQNVPLLATIFSHFLFRQLNTTRLHHTVRMSRLPFSPGPHIVHCHDSVRWDGRSGVPLIFLRAQQKS